MSNFLVLFFCFIFSFIFPNHISLIFSQSQFSFIFYLIFSETILWQRNLSVSKRNSLLRIIGFASAGLGFLYANNNSNSSKLLIFFSGFWFFYHFFAFFFFFGIIEKFLKFEFWFFLCGSFLKYKTENWVLFSMFLNQNRPQQFQLVLYKKKKGKENLICFCYDKF